MLNHDRFEPLLLPLANCRNPKADINVINYFNSKGYQYTQIDSGETIQSKLHPDIIFYQQPYRNFIDKRYFMLANLKSIICHVNYCFRNILDKEIADSTFLNIPFQQYMENEVCAREFAALMTTKGRNLIVTGLPIMDELMQDKSAYEDPWKKMDGNRKRIIYAPHHSIRDCDFLAWGTCLTWGEYILSLAEKYKDKTQWVFKPHPALMDSLSQEWGKERAESYFNRWKQLENAQMVDGRYIEVFKHSDAMIHDCGSFSLEYFYAHKPMMFLYENKGRKDKVHINDVTKEAKSLHYRGDSEQAIEQFIVDVINGIDPMKEQREEFFAKNLTPKGGKSACQNIIDAILGEE